MAQPVTETGKAGDSGSGQGQSEGSDVMEGSGMEEFLTTSRTGRRNAMADISEEKGVAHSANELSLDMAKLSCAEGGAEPASQASQTTSQASNQPS